MVAVEAVMRCPVCRRETTETMPLDRCVVFWPCPSCQAVIRPKAGHCCVYCSYADQACPPMQEGGSCQDPAGQ